MIITFTGTTDNTNSNKKAAALTAGLLSMAYMKSVCVIQLYYGTGIETLMMGKQFKSNMIAALQNVGIDETGIDALLRKTNLKLNAEYFSKACKKMIKTDNKLDILGVSKLPNFENTMLNEAKRNNVKSLIMSANECYDYVLVVFPSDDTMIQNMLSLSDINVCCIKQGDKKEAYLNADGTNYFLITHYDADSIYGVKYVKKAFEEKSIKTKTFVMPHNTQFKDACASEDLMRWLTKNYQITVEDINYDLISKMTDLVSTITGDAPEEPEEPHVKKRQKIGFRDRKKAEKAVTETQPIEG